MSIAILRKTQFYTPLAIPALIRHKPDIQKHMAGGCTEGLGNQIEGEPSASRVSAHS